MLWNRPCSNSEGAIMSFHAKTRIQLLLLGISAGLVSFPADLAAQAATHQPSRTLAVWIEEAQSSPFQGLVMSGTLSNPAPEWAVDDGVEVPDGSSLRQHVSPGRVLGHTLAAATIPMIPGMILAGSALWGDPPDFERRGGQAQGALVIGAIATLVTVPAAAMIAGADSLRRARIGTVTGFVAGSLLGGIALSALSDGEFWIAPVFSLTMGSVTTLIAAGSEGERG